MTQSDIINLFISDIRNCLSGQDIHPLYYGLNYWEHTEIYLNHSNVFRQLFLRKYLERYHERVFCYEFYHKLRVQMDERLDGHNELVYSTRNIFLQSELIKDKINHFIENIYRVTRLSKEFMPDFLLHTPGDFSNQLVVVEVKSTPKLSSSELNEDILKIQEFINNYQYKKGIFIAVNVNEDSMKKLIGRLAKWHPKNINTPERISLFFKDKPYSKLYEYLLNATA